jgi:hypothetical protein
VTQPPYGPPQGQPPYGQPPDGQPQPPASEKKPIWKETWFRVVAALFVIAVIGSALGGGDKDTEASTSGATEAPATGAGVTEGAAEESAEEPAPEPTMPGIGEPAADGKFNFVVQGVDCSLTQIGNQYLGKTAQGQFCIVSLTVTNIGDEAQGFFGDNASLFNADGQEFSADSEAAIYLEESSSLYEEINPGNTLNSKVVFDVPAGTAPATIELHDSAFSGGVTVKLQ